MVQFEQEIEIDALIDHVFEWGNTPENWQRTTPALIDIEILEETEEGTRYRSTTKMLGRTTVNEELYSIDEENHVAVSTFEDGEMDGEMRWSYEETETGTTVRVSADVEACTSLFERAIQPVVSRYMNRQFRNALRTMKELVEAEYDAEQTPPLRA